MIYISSVYYDMKYFLRCSLLLWILLFSTTIFDLAMTSQLQHRYQSQGTRNRPHTGIIDNSDFCIENRKSFLSYNSNELEILSSKNEPSNHKSPSSRNIFLPQGYPKNFTFTPNFRVDSNTLMPYLPMAGCISLLNYYWKYNLSSIEEDRLFGVQIFIFHIYNSSDMYVNINLRILLHSTQDSKLLRPVTIVLSSFLPRRFYLSVLSYLSYTQQPIHFIMTNSNSDIIITDQNLNDSDLARIYISVLDSSYNNIFRFTTPSFDDNNLSEIRERMIQTDLYKYGNFSGFQYNSISTVKRRETLWLFDNGKQFSKRIPNIKLVAIYMIFHKSNAIDLVLGKPEDPINIHNYEFYQQFCTTVKYENYLSLGDRIMTYAMSNFDLDEYRTCSYYITPTLTSLTTPRLYRTVTWLHLETIANVTVHLKLTSNRLFSNDETHLFILTADNVKLPMINIESFFLYKKVAILSNISMSQFDKQSIQNSSLISLKLINTNTHDIASQDQIVANYIAASSSAVMQTTIYKLESAKLYDIRVNVDDSESNSVAKVDVNPSCWCNSNSKISPSLSIDLSAWKLHNNWTPLQLMFENKKGVFKKFNDTLFTFDVQSNFCSSNYDLKLSKVYGILPNERYLLNLPIKYQCAKTIQPNKSISKAESILPQTTAVSQPNVISISEYGFNVFNNSRFKTMLENRSIPDRGRIFIEITQHIAWDISMTDGIHLRDCYITNQKAFDNDLKFSNQSSQNFRKFLIIKGGCINETISDTEASMRTLNHGVIRNLWYRFSIGVDATKWASDLSLYRLWLYHGKMEVHLYCGISRCYTDMSRVSDPIENIGECSAEAECVQKLSTQQIYMYFGPLFIVKESHVELKISVLIILSLVTVILVLILIIFLRGLFTVQSRLKNNSSQIIAYDYRQPSCSEIPIKVRKKSKEKTIYCGLQLSDGVNKLLPEQAQDNTLLSYQSSSLQQLIFESDKSIVLQASYLSPPFVIEPVQSSQGHSHASNVQRQLSQSIVELAAPEDGLVDRPVYSWPLSSVHRNRHSNDSQSSSQPPLPQTLSSRLSIHSTMIRDRFRLTLSNKSKISVTMMSGPCSSNPKLSSNRTTVSGESASASDMTANKSYKWWSPLSNCSLKKNFVMTRN